MSCLQAPLQILLLLLLAVGSQLRGVAACTSYIVGPGASADGSVLIARNDDGDGPWFSSSLVYHPAREGPAVLRANLNNLTTTLPGPGLAYWALPAGPLADAAMGTNTTGAPLLAGRHAATLGPDQRPVLLLQGASGACSVHSGAQAMRCWAFSPAVCRLHAPVAHHAAPQARLPAGMRRAWRSQAPNPSTTRRQRWRPTP